MQWGRPWGDRGLYPLPRRDGYPRYASESRPSGVTHGATLWVVLLISQLAALQVTHYLLKFLKCLSLQNLKVRGWWLEVSEENLCKPNANKLA